MRGGDHGHVRAVDPHRAFFSTLLDPGAVTVEATPRDLVEILLEAHTEMLHVVSLAESLAEGSATASAREAAQQISDYVEWMAPMHCQDEDHSLAPRLLGRHHAVDEALAQMSRQHLALDAPLARLRLLCRTIARDVDRLQALRFEVGRAASDLRSRLKEHQSLEESMIFPALKRLLYVDELVSIQYEMRQRRILAA